MDIIGKAGLSFKQKYHCGKVGTHPDNREGAGLTVGDVHNMVSMLARDGYNPSLQVNALAAQTPPAEEGTRWRKWNESMWKRSAGFLASSPLQEMEICTARGGHSTGAVRLLAFGGKSDKKELTFATDGVTETIKTFRILEGQPSLKNVVETGMEYDRLINTA